VFEDVLVELVGQVQLDRGVVGGPRRSGVLRDREAEPDLQLQGVRHVLGGQLIAVVPDVLVADRHLHRLLPEVPVLEDHRHVLLPLGVPLHQRVVEHLGEVPRVVSEVELVEVDVGVLDAQRGSKPRFPLAGDPGRATASVRNRRDRPTERDHTCNTTCLKEPTARKVVAIVEFLGRHSIRITPQIA
jgi:hypothetical protein